MTQRIGIKDRRLNDVQKTHTKVYAMCGAPLRRHRSPSGPVLLAFEVQTMVVNLFSRGEPLDVMRSMVSLLTSQMNVGIYRRDGNGGHGVGKVNTNQRVDLAEASEQKSEFPWELCGRQGCGHLRTFWNFVNGPRRWKGDHGGGFAIEVATWQILGYSSLRVN